MAIFSTTGSDTYPAGHVIQTTNVVVGTNTSTVNSPVNGSWAASVVAGAITPLYSNSSIIIHAKFNTRMSDASGDAGYGYRFWRSASGITDSYIDSISGWTAGSVHSQMYVNPYNYSTIIEEHDLSWQDNNVSVASTAVTYTLFFSTYIVSAAITCGADYSGRWSIFFQEIKR
jgi:hypothetical protein